MRQAAYLVEEVLTLENIRIQETAYLFDSSLRFNGEIESNDLLAEIHSPDTDKNVFGPITTAQRIRFEYNRQGEVVEMWDANVT